jgi:transaldolase
MLAVMEAIAGLFYVAVFISRLVAVYSARSTADTTGDSPAPLEQSKSDCHHSSETQTP